MALASRALRPRKWAGVLRRMRPGAPRPGGRLRGRGGFQFQVRVRSLPRVAWAPRPVAGRRPALKWGGRPGRPRARMGALARSLRPRLRRRLRAWPVPAWAAMTLVALLVLPFLGDGALVRHLAPYWEATGAPLARWVHPDATTAARLVTRAAPHTGAPPADPGGGAASPGVGSGGASGPDEAGGVWAEARAWLRDVSRRLPQWMLTSELPLLSREAAAPAVSERPGGADLPGGGRQPAPPEPPAPAPEPPRPVPGAPGEPLVLIYHSHTSETYREPGRELLPAASYHRFNSRETGVVRAGAALARALEARGVPVLHDTGVYDYPSHPSAYLESGRAVAALLRQHPSIQAVIDLHRDTPADMTATVGGRKVARVTLVVATAVTSGLPHPGWRQNLAFAQTLARMMNERTPGLLDRILQVPSRRYNQELHPHALLVEVGSYHNTQEEADAAAELLAESLAEAVLAAGARSGPPAAEGRETP